MYKGTNQSPTEEKEWHYRSIFDAANDGLIITDLETGRVVEANPAACLMHGYTRDEFIGLYLTTFIHPDSQKAFYEYIRAFQADGVFDIRSLHLRRDGATFPAKWHGTTFTYLDRRWAGPSGALHPDPLHGYCPRSFCRFHDRGAVYFWLRQRPLHRDSPLPQCYPNRVDRRAGSGRSLWPGKINLQVRRVSYECK